MAAIPVKAGESVRFTCGAVRCMAEWELTYEPKARDDTPAMAAKIPASRVQKNIPCPACGQTGVDFE